MVVASAIIGVFYTVGRESWSTNGLYYEGAFSLFGSIIITIMGAALLRVTKMQDKWRVKLAKAVDSPLRLGGRKGIATRFMEKYAMFILPFVTVLREGIEAVVFVAGVSFTAPATAFPLPVICGLLVGGIVGYILYRYDYQIFFFCVLSLSARRDSQLTQIHFTAVVSAPDFKSSLSSRLVSSTLLPLASSLALYGTLSRPNGTRLWVAMLPKSAPDQAPTILPRVSGTSMLVMVLSKSVKLQLANSF